MTVHPRDRSVSIAGWPVPADGAEPPDWSNTPAAIPDATSDTRMLSMLVWVRAVFVNALKKSPPFILSKALAGKLVRLMQSRQALLKVVPADVSMSGKLVRLVQPFQATLKLVPADVSMSGKLVRLEQPHQVNLKVVPADVSIRGKLVRLEQSNQANPNSVPADVSIGGKLVRLSQPFHAAPKLVPEDVSIRGKLVISDQFRQKLLKSVTAP